MHSVSFDRRPSLFLLLVERRIPFASLGQLRFARHAADMLESRAPGRFGAEPQLRGPLYREHAQATASVLRLYLLRLVLGKAKTLHTST